MSDILITKGQDQDRVQRRLEKYRARHEESIPRFEHTLNGINEQQRQETLLLRQRFLEPKAKKSSKKNDKKGTQSPAEIQNTTGGTKTAKRDRNDDADLIDQQQNGNEQMKHGHANGSPSPTYKKRKGDTFPPDTGQQVKNGSTSISPVSNLKLTPKESPVLTPTPNRFGGLTQPLKQEMNHTSNFADLDQCAAALEKDGTTSIGLMEGSSGGLIPSDTLKDLIFDISDLNPDFIGDFDFDEDRHAQSTNQSCFSTQFHHATNVASGPVTFSPRNVKMEEGPSPAAMSVNTASPHSHPSQTPPQASSIFDSASPSATNQNHSTSRSSTPNPSYCQQTTSPTTGSAKSIRMPYESPTNMGHDSPAAQTLKQMAQQHQQSNSPARSPFGGDPYSPLSGDFVPTGPSGPFRNVRCHVSEGVVVKQENPPPGMYGACPSYPNSPVDLMALKKSKMPGHSKSFTQPHLNPQLPPSYRNSFSPPTSSFPPNNQQIFMQHKINQSPQLNLQQQHNLGNQGPQMGMGSDLKGPGVVPMSHHQAFSGSQYYQGAVADSCFTGAQDKGQTINFTQQHLRFSQTGHSQQQGMGRMSGIGNPGQQPVSHMDRSRPPVRLPHGGLEIPDETRMPMEVQQRMMMREGCPNPNEMVGRFSNGNPIGPPSQAQRLNTHRHQLITDPGYHHQPMGQSHMGISPPRRHIPCQLPPQQEVRMSNQPQHCQHLENWHTQSVLPDHMRSFHQHQHFHTTGVNQQQYVSTHPPPGGFGSYGQNPNQRILPPKAGKVMGSSEDGVVLKTETDSDFNLLLGGIGDDYSFDPTSSYQNILDTF